MENPASGSEYRPNAHYMAKLVKSNSLNVAGSYVLALTFCLPRN